MLKLNELTAEDITALLANGGYKRAKRRSEHYGVIVEAAGVTVINNPTACEKGGFIGRTGTKRRSRKGRVSVRPNGSRIYDGSGQITAYTATKIV